MPACKPLHGHTALFGLIVLQAAAGTVKRVSLELGGNAPFIVFPDAGGQAGRAAAAGAQPAVHAATHAWQHRTALPLWFDQQKASQVCLLVHPCMKRRTSPAPPHADLEKAARAVVASSHRNAGQTCICTNRVLVHVRVVVVCIA